MRWLIVLAALSGCDAAGLLKVQSTIDMRTRGVALHHDGKTGRLASRAGSWAFKVRTGVQAGRTADALGDDDEVQDVGSSRLGARSVVIVGDDGVLVADGVRDLYARLVEVPALQARLWSGGLVVLAPDCQLSWMDLDGVISAAAPGACVPGEVFAADPETGRVAFAHEGGVTLADLAHEVVVDLAASAIERDRDGWVIASGQAVAALDLDGDPRWTVELAGPVRAIGAARDADLVIAALDLGDDGEIVVLDGASGSIVLREETPIPGESLAVSADGSAFAVVVGDRVHLLSVRE